MHTNIFRAYDIRGVYPTEINEASVSKIINSAFKHFIHKSKKSSGVTAVVGRDVRLSSPSLYKTLIKEIENSGYKVKIHRAGIITTPMLDFLANKLKADIGIMVTASHNPPEYNGLKMLGRGGVPISGRDIKNKLNKQ